MAVKKFMDYIGNIINADDNDYNTGQLTTYLNLISTEFENDLQRIDSHFHPLPVEDAEAFMESVLN